MRSVHPRGTAAADCTLRLSSVQHRLHFFIVNRQSVTLSGIAGTLASEKLSDCQANERSVEHVGTLPCSAESSPIAIDVDVRELFDATHYNRRPIRSRDLPQSVSRLLK